MTEFKQNILFIGYSLYGLRNTRQWWTPQEMKNEIDWLNGQSLYGIETYLFQAEKKGYVSCKSNGKDLIYKGLRKAFTDYNKIIPE